MLLNRKITGLTGFFQTQWGGTMHLLLALSLVSALALTPMHAQGDELGGKAVVETICAACHATGSEGAPMIGDGEAWSNRFSQGLTSLTRNAVEGIRKMPAHGGSPGLSDLEIARAVTYMVNLSGGNWVEPLSVEELAEERSGEQVVKAQCITCHGEGLNGAPKIGNLEDWVPRMKLGLEYLQRSSIRGHGGMPPRGGRSDLTDSEIRSAILYMYNPAGMPAKAPISISKTSQGAGTDASHQSVEGIDVHLGFLPAENLHAFPLGSPERSMHGGVPRGAGYYHINVSLYDEKSQFPIRNARVQMELQQPGMSSFVIELQPMMIGAAGSYGNYLQPRLRTQYRIILRIARPGAVRTVDAIFERTFE